MTSFAFSGMLIEMIASDRAGSVELMKGFLDGSGHASHTFTNDIFAGVRVMMGLRGVGLL